jgi:hypothetical protein
MNILIDAALSSREGRIVFILFIDIICFCMVASFRRLMSVIIVCPYTQKKFYAVYIHGSRFSFLKIGLYKLSLHFLFHARV